jgi:hypothetical protein
MVISNESGVALIIEESPPPCGQMRTKVEDFAVDSEQGLGIWDY